ncbi:MAG TPA: TauD/TfdA family dioxygenase [Thermoanaerobaculia bacterium]|nr:TauD/TfdA family dioxygenase [Thermoanaerobaculia bacterium]
MNSTRTIIIQVPTAASEAMYECLLHSPSPLEDPEGSMAAGITAIAKHLPQDALLALIRYRSDPHAPGVTLVRGLPVDRHLPATPADGEPSTEKRTHISEAVTLGFATLLGEPYAFLPEKGGRLVHDIVPVCGKETAHSNAGSLEPLGLHIEAAAFGDAAPEYVLLFGLRTDHDRVACTLTADVRDAQRRLDARYIRELRTPGFKLLAPESFADGGLEYSRLTPVITGPEDAPQVILNMDRMQGITPAAAEALEAFGAALAHPDVLRRTHIDRGDLVVIGNRRTVHGRTTFVPRWDGRDRWLQRVYVTPTLWPLRHLSDGRRAVALERQRAVA